MHNPWNLQSLLSRAQPGSALVCILCGQPIVDGRGAPTTDGRHVHIRCADAQATQAFKRRQWYALFHLGAWGLGLGSWIVGGSHWMLAVVVIGAVLHPVLHRRWWRIAFRLRRKF